VRRSVSTRRVPAAELGCARYGGYGAVGTHPGMVGAHPGMIGAAGAYGGAFPGAYGGAYGGAFPGALGGAYAGAFPGAHAGSARGARRRRWARGVGISGARQQRAAPQCCCRCS